MKLFNHAAPKVSFCKMRKDHLPYVIVVRLKLTVFEAASRVLSPRSYTINRIPPLDNSRFLSALSKKASCCFSSGSRF